MTIIHQIADITGLKLFGLIGLDLATIGLLFHESPMIEQATYWIEFGLKILMMVVAIGAHYYAIRNARNKRKQKHD